jgi:hypothetical protein
MQRVLAILSFVFLGGCSTVPTSFTPSNPVPPGEVSHGLWQELLSEHVHDGVVDYPAIARQGQLQAYLALLNRVDPAGLSVGERLAFWINAYNAFAVKGILDGYAPDTLFGRYRYFIARDYSIGRQPVNLYNLERGILIAQFHEPRVHFAIVCASTSCPKLQSWAYEGQCLDEQLNRVTSEFVNDPLRNRFDRSRKVASLSMIFKWFAKDFEARSGAILSFVAGYVQDPSLKQDLLAGDYTVEFLEYDWSLNGLPPQ